MSQTDGGSVIVDLKEVSVKSEVLKLVPRELCERGCVLPLWVGKRDVEGGVQVDVLFLAAADSKDVFTRLDIHYLTGYQLEFLEAPEADIRAAIIRCYGVMKASEPTPKGVSMPETIADISAFVNGAVLTSYFGNSAKEVHFQPVEGGYIVTVKLEKGIKSTGRAATEKEMVAQYVEMITKDNRVIWKVSHQVGEDVPILSAEVFTCDLLDGKLIIFRDFKQS